MPCFDFTVPSVDVKLDPLGERKLTAEIDGVGDAAHIAFHASDLPLARRRFPFRRRMRRRFPRRMGPMLHWRSPIGAFGGKELFHLANISREDRG